MQNIINAIEVERQRQDNKWGVQNHSPIEWIGILSEEVGEAAKEAVDFRFYNHNASPEVLHNLDKVEILQRYRYELIQCAAVIISMLESVERNELKQ